MNAMVRWITIKDSPTLPAVVIRASFSPLLNARRAGDTCSMLALSNVLKKFGGWCVLAIIMKASHGDQGQHRVGLLPSY